MAYPSAATNSHTLFFCILILAVGKTCANGCNYPVWSKKLCKSCWLKQYGKPINKASDTRKEEDEQYFRERELFLKEHVLCEMKVPDVCTRVANTIQHLKGRAGDRYLDKSGWMAGCRECNFWAAVHSKEAIAMGIAEFRNHKE